MLEALLDGFDGGLPCSRLILHLRVPYDCLSIRFKRAIQRERERSSNWKCWRSDTEAIDPAASERSGCACTSQPCCPLTTSHFEK